MPIRYLRRSLVAVTVWLLAVTITILRSIVEKIEPGGLKSPANATSSIIDHKKNVPTAPFPGMKIGPPREVIWHLYIDQPTHHIPKTGKGEWDMILDVRSPKEYQEDHIPGSISTPVLDNDARAIVGTKYKKDRFLARRIGAAMISDSISALLKSDVLNDKPQSSKILVVCWRGGERSHSLATILARVGYRTAVLKGGYQAYRKRVRQHLSTLSKLKYIVIAGPTGSGKTLFLDHLKQNGAQVIDLEKAANHKGSILGDCLESGQPTQKMFEGILAKEVQNIDPTKPVYIEDEASRIGNIHLPIDLWKKKKQAKRVSLEVDVPLRVRNIRADYTYFELKKNFPELQKRLEGLRKVVGKKSVDRYINLAEEGKWDELVEDLLRSHYDHAYAKAVSRNTPDDVKNTTGNQIAMKVGLASEGEYNRAARDVIERFKLEE